VLRPDCADVCFITQQCADNEGNLIPTSGDFSMRGRSNCTYSPSAADRSNRHISKLRCLRYLLFTQRFTALNSEHAIETVTWRFSLVHFLTHTAGHR
jgi:hypothetical protein